MFSGLFVKAGRLGIIAIKFLKDAKSIFQQSFHGRRRCQIVRSLLLRPITRPYSK